VAARVGLTRFRGHLMIGPSLRRCCDAAYPPYPPQFRVEAVRLARSGGWAIAALAADSGVSPQALRRWLRQADTDVGRGQPGALTTDEREALRRPRWEAEALQQEREMLRKAAAYFAQETP
jgi:transposase